MVSECDDGNARARETKSDGRMTLIRRDRLIRSLFADSSMQYRLGDLEEKLVSLERTMDVLEASVKFAETSCEVES